MKAAMDIILTLTAFITIHTLAFATESSPVTGSPLPCDTYLVPSIVSEFEAVTFGANTSATARTDDNRNELRQEAIRLYKAGDFQESLRTTE